MKQPKTISYNRIYITSGHLSSKLFVNQRNGDRAQPLATYFHYDEHVKDFSFSSIMSVRQESSSLEKWLAFLLVITSLAVL